MPNTYSQIYLHFVFTVKYREALIPGSHKEELHKYITALVQNRDAKMLAVHCMPDHIHLFIGYKPTINIPDFVNQIKVESTRFITESKWVTGKFNWQTGYGVFSYSHSQIDRVIKYIRNQETHHKHKSFKEEYTGLLKRFDVRTESRYLFHFFD